MDQTGMMGSKATLLAFNKLYPISDKTRVTTLIYSLYSASYIQHKHITGTSDLTFNSKVRGNEFKVSILKVTVLKPTNT
ncbi:hypothetical protein Hanom_Chr12g01116871 [Helianthus anomalus]